MTPLGAILAGLNQQRQRQQQQQWHKTSLNATLATGLPLLFNATFAPNSIDSATSTLATLINATAASATASHSFIQADQCAEQQQITTPTNVSAATQLTSTTTTMTTSGNLLGDEHLYVRLSTFWYCFLAFITSLGLVVSLVSNMIIIYLFTGTPSLRKNPSNIIAVNLSLSDLLYCIQWPSVIYCSLSQTTWLLEIEYVCQTFGFITLITASASILTVLAMSIERAIVIRCTLHARNRLTMRHAWLVLLLIWCTSLAISLPPLFGTFNKYTLDPSKTSCTLDYLSSKPNYKLYTLVLYFAYWFVPTVIISICYALIIRTFGSSSRSLLMAGRRGSARPGPARQPEPDNTVNHDSAVGTVPPLLAIGHRQTRLSSVSCELTGGGGGAPNSLRRELKQPLKSSLSLRSARRAKLPRIRPARLRDSIRLDNFIGQLASAAAATTTTTSARVRPAQPPHLGHGQVTDKGLVRQMARQVSTDGDEDDEAQGEGEEARNACALTSLSLCTSSTLEDDDDDDDEEAVAARSAAGELSELELEPSSGTSTTGRHDMHQVDPIVKMSPLYQGQEQQKQQNVTRKTPLSWWCWPKFASANFGTSPAASAPTRPSKLSFDDASAGSKPTCHELSSLRSTRAAVTSSGGTNARTINLDMSATAATLAGSGADRLRAAQLKTTNRTCRPRLRSVSCHFGGSSGHLSRTSMQIRLAKMSFYLILLWLVSWTPIASLALINSLVKCHHRASALAVFLANTMTKLGPAFDVFIYGVSHPKIKKKFRQIIKWLLMFGRTGSGSRASTDSERQADSLRERNASIRSKCCRPNASLAVY